MERARIRLHVEHPLGPGQAVPLTEAQAHYLFGVMRLGAGARVALFNGRDGEWTAEVARAAKRGGDLACIEQAAPQLNPPDLWLVFAPIKKARTDFIVEKAAELGAARIIPVQTDFTNSERIRQDRLQAHAVEAAEQCGGTFVPEVSDLVPLAKVLAGWDGARRILWADESLAGPAETLAGLAPGPWAILIGPEGGFSEPERARLRGLPFVTPVSLGPRILRADTAACAALTLWQAALGDWR
ncbi:16S rRNA (uracil(1498)-N(3))-methyltransferase [Phaeovulum sp. NW3]|uniref:16S rRNA (uracil(1498)-N(3))-methyltransferase n=1 Tax=Phaeovulum sp. NW3 TaxID=2934933 RepID=UPI0020211DF6|nr:16S rRNA (uracil(1498)-N(3))-methyltransferase [Phaeovulum sp. NW3]MCL7463834.1 16S rRNA (uracil(1498)-N(3))-methyltransferase [Phaeovulum sp. NW3]